MKRTLRFVAIGFALATVLVWLVAGANPGWTKTSIAIKSVDEVTGIEGITYKRQFIPGIDFLGGALLGAGALAAASFLFRNKSNH